LGFIKKIQYEQWQITYNKFKQYDDFGDLYLPSKITVTDNHVTLRLSLRSWTTETDL